MFQPDYQAFMENWTSVFHHTTLAAGADLVIVECTS